MSSSEDDMPLAKGNPGIKMNGNSYKSKDTIPESVDKAMDKANPPVENGAAGISIRNGPVEEMDIDTHQMNGTSGKRKSRGSLGQGKSYREASDEDDEDDIPLNKKPRLSQKKVEDDSDDVPLASKKGKVNSPALAKKPVKASNILESDDSDEPLGQQLAKQKATIQKKAAKEAKVIRKEQSEGRRKSVKKEESDDDIPLAKKALKKQSNGTGTPAKKANSTKKTNLKAEVSTPKKKSKAVKQEELDEDQEGEEEEEQYRWWENLDEQDGTKKWDTLEHNGVVFPPPYEPLPKSVKLLYDGVPVNLASEAEEVATFFGSMLNSTLNVENPTFQKNFFSDFQEELKKTGGAKDRDGNKVSIKSFEKCDFKKIFEYFDAQRNEKKALSSAEKKALKAQKDEAEKPFMYCKWDGRTQKVGNFRIEPPGLFRGRGDHPKTGHVKKRVRPEQITINIGKEAMVPAPPEGHRWKEVKHDNEGTWLATWQENINGAYKYVMLAANSDIKGQSDYKKFEKARELKKHIDTIRRHYEHDLKDRSMEIRQRATAVYLIDQFALRAGNEKGDNEADTVGCCSLKAEHVTLKPPNKVIFDFLGKDSIRFYDEVTVADQVFKNLKIFKKPLNDGDKIFDRISTSSLNNHLSTFMPGLTAKVLRTYNASFTMANVLGSIKSIGPSVAEKMKKFHEANKKVAILCNHKRTVGAGHGAQMEKLTDRIKGLRYQQWRTKQMMLDIDTKAKKQMEKKHGPSFFELDDDLDQAWIEGHQKFLVEEQRQKIQKKFEKDNVKRKADGEKEMKQKELEERLADATELAKKFKKENKKGKVEAEGKGVTVEKLESKLETLDQRVTSMKVQAEDKESNKEVSLTTSINNYIDPRLLVMFSKKFDVPIEKLLGGQLRSKFEWAIQSADVDWEF